MAKMTTVSVLASGRGSNFQAMLDHKRLGVFENVDVGVLIYNRPDAKAKSIADAYGIDNKLVTHKSGRIQFYNEITDALKHYDTDLVCLTGWQEIIGKEFIDPYRWRIMNDHPALLPAYGEKNLNALKVHESVLRDGVKVTGCTVYFVGVSIENGPIISQQPVEVGEMEKRLFWEDAAKGLALGQNRGVELLSNKVLVFEHRLYPKAIQLFADGKLRVETHTITESKNSEICQDDTDAVMIDSDEEWERRWNERQKTFTGYQLMKWKEKGFELEVLISPQH